MMYTTTKARLHPTDEQRDVLFTMLNAGKMVYNRVRMELFQDYRSDRQNSLRDISVYEDVAINFANENKSVVPIPDNSVRAVAKDVYTSITSRPPSYYTACKVRNFPRKTANSSMNIHIDDVRTYHDYVLIPNVGKIRCAFSNNDIFMTDGFAEGKKTRATISVSNHAVMSIIISRVTKSKKKLSMHSEDRVLGLDYGLLELATLSTGEILKLPKKVHLIERRMRFYQSKRDTAIKSSNSYKRWDAKYRSAYIKWRDLINGYCRYTANRLYSDYDIIVAEPLAINDILFHKRGYNRNCQNPKSNICGNNVIQYHAHNYTVLNSGLPELYKWLRRTADRLGKRFITTYHSFPSTKLCSVCGFRNDNIRGTDIREWTCPNCGTIHNRDVNAARNMKAYGIRFMNNVNKQIEVSKQNKNLINGCDSRNVDTNLTTSIQPLVSEISDSYQSIDSDELTMPILNLSKDTLNVMQNGVNTLVECSQHDLSKCIDYNKLENSSSTISNSLTESTEGLQNCEVITPLTVKTDGKSLKFDGNINDMPQNPDDGCVDISQRENSINCVKTRIHDMLLNSRNSRRRISVLHVDDASKVKSSSLLK